MAMDSGGSSISDVEEVGPDGAPIPDGDEEEEEVEEVKDGPARSQRTSTMNDYFSAAPKAAKRGRPKGSSRKNHTKAKNQKTAGPTSKRRATSQKGKLKTNW